VTTSWFVITTQDDIIIGDTGLARSNTYMHRAGDRYVSRSVFDERHW